MVGRFLDWVGDLVYDRIDYIAESVLGRLALCILIPIFGIPMLIATCIGIILCGPYTLIRWVIKGKNV